MAKIAIFAPEKESLMVTTTTNSHETSTTVTRPDSTKIDFCYMTDGEFIIGETSGDDHHHIALNLEEAQVLHQKLSAILG